VTRVAFVGQRTYFEVTALTRPAGGLEPHFVDHRGGADEGPTLARLAELRPDVVIVFRPEILPAGALDDVPALTLGFNTEPLPRGGAAAGAAHPDQLWRLSELAQTDTAQFDRIMTFDPLSAAAAPPDLEVWRSVPLPVDDRLFAPVRPMKAPPQIAFIGYSTDHREAWLVDAKHHFDVLHVAHGVSGAALRDLFGRTDVALNLHGHPYPSFENRVCLHLAAGHLVISEPLSPSHGLEPGIDYLEVTSPHQLLLAIQRLRAARSPYDGVRRRGRRKAEQFRASRVWPRLVGDLARDVAVFGSRRRGARGPRHGGPPSGSRRP
jgi:hypothetical protein